MKTPKELKGATTNLMVLIILQKGESYGYEMTSQFEKLTEGQIKWKAASMYPVLKKMEQSEMIESFWKIDGFDRPRKYYRILNKGIEALEIERKKWELMNSVITRL